MSGDGMPFEGAECCILEICCGGEEREKALADKLQAGIPTLNKNQAYAVAEFLATRYTLVPLGLLEPFIRHYATMARAYPPEPGY